MVFERVLPGSAERAFAALSEPARMNRWSLAPVESIAAGDGDHPGGVGALRAVTVPGPRPLRLEEIIEVSEPPRRLEYRVVRGAPVRHHRGVVELVPGPGGVALRWTVEIDAPAPLRAAAELLVRRRLDASLDRLAAILSAPDDDAPALPPRRGLDEAAALPALVTAAEAIAAEQGALADRLLAAGDDRGWFARTYRYVTEAQLAACAAGSFAHPAWVLRLVPVFHRWYVASLLPRLGEANGEVEAHWRRAFLITERLRPGGRPPFETAVRSIHAGARAHIEFDLPRTLAEVYLVHYADRCDYVRFRADYLRMGDVFNAAGDRLLADLPRGEWPVRARLLDRVTPRELRERVMNRRFYPIRSRRREAFDRGLGLVRMVAAVGGSTTGTRSVSASASGPMAQR
jgi:uncharacterized protein YndB with AHSA1/START domain